MKKIFHNNQIIITSLAILIAIAGYLNFTNERIGNVGVTSEYYQAEGDFNGEDSIEVAQNNNDDNKDKEEDEYKEDNKTQDVNTEKVNNKEGGNVIKEGEIEGEVVESSAEDGESSIGEAVMVNSTSSVNYFYNVKLNREQARAKNKEELIEVVENTAISEDKKEEAVNKIIELTANSERENSAEMMLKARGFENAVVSIVDGKADVIVDAKSITEEQVAQIVDIVNRKTGIENKDIVVTPVNSK